MRAVRAAAVIALLVWALWWLSALLRLELPFAHSTWIATPAFGVDFLTQPDYAARTWMGRVDPYADRSHLFHYPPIVIRLFLWTPYLSPVAALRVWIGILALLLVGGTIVAWKTRRRLGIEAVPLEVALIVVLFSFPALFAMERSNFDLITLAAILVALPLQARRSLVAELAAGCLLAVGPWVKIYPGLIGLALLALRRFRILAGFVIGGLAIGLAAPAETLRSFEVLGIAVARTHAYAVGEAYAPWKHSLSMAWMNIAETAAQHGRPQLMLLRGSLVAGIILLPLLVWVSASVYRCKRSEALTYPLLLWVVAVGSFVPEIANDYSLAFFPLAVVSVYSRRDPPLVHALMALTLLWLQPVALPLPGAVLLLFKFGGIVAVGAMLVRRARELASQPTDQRAAEPAGAADAAPGKAWIRN